MPNAKSKLVYSTDKPVSRKEKPVQNHQTDVPPMHFQKVTLRLDRKGRSGKTVTVVEGLQMPQKKMEELLRQLKARLGTGGTTKDQSLEIQGDHRDMLMSSLKAMGYAPRRSG